MNRIKKIEQWINNNLKVILNRFAKRFRRLYADQHQLTSVTGKDRYPQLFFETAKVIGGEKPLTILSFGCSSGEECFSLKHYFPNSKIVGVDINKLNLKQAKKSNVYKDVEFFLSSKEIIEEKGPYDIVFCLSVLCRWEDTLGLQNCENVYPFAKYNATIEMLARQIKKNGLLVIYNSNFRFEDTDIYSGFEIVETPSIGDSGFVTKFNRDNNVMNEIHRHCLYRKK